MELELAGHAVHLLYQKAIFLPEFKALIIADLHLGKIEHFRNSGVGLPSKAGQETFSKLKDLIESISPEHVMFLGDLFHSVKNNSFVIFKEMLQGFEHIQFYLISGNHDILSESDYTSLRMEVKNEMWLGGFWLTHEPSQLAESQFFNIAGHIHPGILLNGKAKQSLRMACFVQSENSMILPAFGYFTGFSNVKKTSNSRIFAIAEKHIFEVS